VQNQRVADSIVAWDNAFLRLATRALGDSSAMQLNQAYLPALTSEYKHLVSPRYALKDMLHLDNLGDSNAYQVSLLNPSQGIVHYRLHFYSPHERYLDEYIPALENMALRVMDQVQFRITANGVTRFIKSFTVKAANGQKYPFCRLKHRLLEAISGVMNSHLENDPLNKLLILSGLSWRAIDVLRAYRNYYLQIHHQTTRASIHHALIHNPDIALCLFTYFEARFRPHRQWDDPAIREEQALFPLRVQLLESMTAVVDLNDDRILRILFNLIDATMRCNFHLHRDWPDYFVAVKINSLGVIDMPAPKPQNEIYVHAVDMEGIHLRAGKISRGGIRWSDRPDDFRVEILGLMQTQVSKNALIIPTGAKGGFVVKHNGSRVDIKAAGKKAYITLMRGLLDLTDNYQDNQIVQMPQLVCYDDPDPYLVVAADKGTAQFSDTANAVAAEYRFWLGDAFASGGSQGYDHKVLGITARGAWECVKRHFRELGKDIQTEAFTVVGIGSMDGDVFGNGMLLSPHIRLLAAFSGQHIFIDPNPMDNGAAFQERKRLFGLPGSTWMDYNSALISQGGGVYLRSAKDIAISSELKKWLAIRYSVLDGESLIRYLLTAPVELLWLGGIGTYIKASSEKHEDVGDRSNDNVRINATDLKANVVGEGANLGFTQKARIEYHLNGGRINTDAVDNSAGVDTSDHEVNLKILLTGLHNKHLISDPQSVFDELTEAVCRQVLANNIAQSLCLSLEEIRNTENPVDFLQVAEKLEASSFLDKAVESFPSDKDILSRPNQILTRPELAVLMAAGKMYLTRHIQAESELLPEDVGTVYLEHYFPEQISTRYKTYLSTHPLAQEIKATVLSNKMINQAGCRFLNVLEEHEGLTVLDYINNYLSFDDVLDGDVLRQAIYALDNQLAAAKQYELLLQLENTLSDLCRWTLAQEKSLANPQTIANYTRYLAAYNDYVKQHNTQYQQRITAYLQDDIPDSIAEKTALLGCMSVFPLIVRLATETERDVTTVLALFHETSQYLNVDDIAAQLALMSAPRDWERKISADITQDISRVVGTLVKTILLSSATTCAGYFATSTKKQKINQYWRTHQELHRNLPATLVHYLVLNKALGELL
jgi:glutamate dehydrogenase